MISLIVAAFNAERFIGEAMESVIYQSEAALEMIVVDDGSTDSTLRVAKSTAGNDPRVSVVSIPHGGQSAARNAGIDIARGDFLFFLDADDLILPETLGLLRSIAAETGADIVCGGIRKFRGSVPRATRRIRNGATEILSGRDAAVDILYQRGKTDNSMCGKLFRSHLFSGIRFREGTTYEDLDLFYHLFLRSRLIAVTPAPLYLYRQHPGSFIHTFSRRRADALDVTARLRRFMELRGDEALAAGARSRQLSANFNILLLTLRHSRKLGKGEGREIRRRCMKTIEELGAGCLHDRNVRLKNKIAIVFRKLFAHL